MTTSHPCLSISFLVPGAVCAVGEGDCCVVWSDGGPFHDSVEDTPIAEDFELGCHSEFEAFLQEEVAEHPDQEAPRNTASLRVIPEPLRGTG
ncbi:MAG: hypothetical protein KJ901_13345, partial [Gammaproteobacteria bacterium]|nr:hypothetical protein [Gammaproteobacteria bacterium]MBU1443879.1 hypothetical protein [Gammaproteobacteria bacterium]